MMKARLFKEMAKNCEGCRFYGAQHCTKYRKNGKCEPSSKKWLNEELTICHIDRMCELSTIFGNAYVAVTDDDIEKLKRGEALHFECAEYGIFLGYVGDK